MLPSASFSRPHRRPAVFSRRGSGPAAGQPAREGASALLEAVLERHRTLEEALGGLRHLEARDRGAAHRIAAAVLRRYGTLNAVLEPFLQRRPPAPALHALLLGSAELLLLGTPAHAAVASAVAAVPKPLAGLVNAVLRRVAEGGPALLAGLDGPRLDTPPWLWSAWQQGHGAARAIARAHQHEAPLDLTLMPGAEAPEGGQRMPNGSWRYPAGTRVVELPGFAEGRFWVQDAAASMPAALLAVRPGEQVADLCAAPGGKTLQLAAAGADVVAVERDSARAARMRENLTRMQLPVTLVEADLTTWDGGGRQYDAVLLDAPCTATGTIRRHPDLPFLKRSQDVAPLAATQAGLLRAASRLLAPGGRLIFATCSLQPEEGEAHLAQAASLGLVFDPFSPEELAFLPEGRNAQGALRTRPDFWAEQGGMDGFFAARFRRAR